MHRRLLEKFLNNTRQQVACIEAAALVGDARKAADLAHKLKSSARSVGALALAELCQQIETAGFAGEHPSCTAVVAKLAPTFTLVQACMDADLGRTADIQQDCPD